MSRPGAYLRHLLGFPPRLDDSTATSVRPGSPASAGVGPPARSIIFLWANGST